MAQVTWRADDELVERARARARALGTSMNGYVTRVIDAATDPDLAGSEAHGLRERLSAAGLLEDPGPVPVRPPEERVRAAGRRAAQGRPVSEILLEDRGPR